MDDRDRLPKTCRYCQQCNASSKEHVIADSRLKAIKSFHTTNQNNDNIQKTYRGITCEKCNNKLGKYEEERWSNLAYSTIWKILSGNINKVFNEDSEYQLKNSDEKCINFFESQFLNIIKSKKVAPANTFTFDISTKNINDQNKFNLSTKKVEFEAYDIHNNPIKDISYFIKDRGGSNNEKEYFTKTDRKGKAYLNILTRIESIKIVTEKLNVENRITKQKIQKDIDVITYISFTSNSRRLAVILPMLCSINTGWKKVKISMGHKSFLKILQDNVSDVQITSISPYWKNGEVDIC